MPEDNESQPKGLFRFRANLTSPTISIHEGEYHRLFKADEQPFAAETDEEYRMLKASDLFVELKGEELKTATGAAEAAGAEAGGSTEPPAPADSVEGGPPATAGGSDKKRPK